MTWWNDPDVWGRIATVAICVSLGAFVIALLILVFAT